MSVETHTLKCMLGPWTSCSPPCLGSVAQSLLGGALFLCRHGSTPLSWKTAACMPAVESHPAQCRMPSAQTMCCSLRLNLQIWRLACYTCLLGPWTLPFGAVAELQIPMPQATAEGEWFSSFSFFLFVSACFCIQASPRRSLPP